MPVKLPCGDLPDPDPMAVPDAAPKTKPDPSVRRPRGRPRKKIRARASPTSPPDLPPAPKSFPFLKLPSELRDKIYDLVVVKRFHKQPICKCGTNPNPQLSGFDVPKIGMKTRSGPFEPNLTKACKQIRNEILPILYGRNNFVIRLNDFQTQGMDGWMELLGAARARLIKNVVLVFEGSTDTFNITDHVISRVTYLPNCALACEGNTSLARYYMKIDQMIKELRVLGLGWDQIRANQNHMCYILRDAVGYDDMWAWDSFKWTLAPNDDPDVIQAFYFY